MYSSFLIEHQEYPSEVDWNYETDRQLKESADLSWQRGKSVFDLFLDLEVIQNRRQRINCTGAFSQSCNAAEFWKICYSNLPLSIHVDCLTVDSKKRYAKISSMNNFSQV